EGTICDVAHNCGPDYSATCASGYDPTGETCMSGGEQLIECEPHDCGDAYPYQDECPEGYADSGNTCLSGEHIMHSCDICADGYGKKNGVCVPYAGEYTQLVPDDQIVNGRYLGTNTFTYNSDDEDDLYHNIYGAKLNISQTHLAGTLEITNNSDSNIYGIYNESGTIHNVCNGHGGVGDNTLIIHNNGDGNVWAEYAPSITYNGTGVSTVEITNTGKGNVTGYYATGGTAQNAGGGAATLDITNTGDGVVTGMYAYSNVTNSQNVAGGSITIMNTADTNGGAVYGMKSDNGMAYNTTAGTGELTITNTGNGLVMAVSGSGNVFNTSGAGAGTITVENKGAGSVTGMESNNGASYNAYSTGLGNLSITNEGNGMVTGVHGYTDARNSGNTGAGTITIENTGNGEVIGMISDNGTAYNAASNGSGELTITNTGNGPVTALSGKTQVYNSYGAGGGTITIENDGTGMVYGMKSENGNVFNASNGIGNLTIHQLNADGNTVTGISSTNGEARNSNSSSGSGTITIESNGTGGVYGITAGSNAYNTSNGDGLLSITNTGNGSVTGIVSGTNVYNARTGNTKTGTISITNNGSGDIWGMVGSTGEAVNSYSGTGNLSITNTGNGTVTGIEGLTAVYNSRNTNGGDISITNNGTGSVYGIKSLEGAIYNSISGTGQLTIKQLNQNGGYVYGLYGSGTGNVFNANSSSSSIIGIVDILNNGKGGAYGLQALSGNATNYNNDQINIQNTHTGSATGMYVGASKTLTNWGSVSINNLKDGWVVGLEGSSNATILNKNSGHVTITRDTYTDTDTSVTYNPSSEKGGYVTGIDGYGCSAITNEGEITINGAETAWGISYQSGSGSVTNKGTITITNAETGYGIYYSGNGTITNSGEINVSADNAYGIYVSSGGATIKNTGTIILNGDTCTGDCSGGTTNGNYIHLGGSTLMNAGAMSAKSLNIASMKGTLTALPGAQFNIENDISGDLNLSSELTTQGFDTTYVSENMINAGDTSGLNLISESALFDAALADNGHDVVMTMKGFDTATKNSSLAKFLTHNYAAGNNEEFFNKLKSIGNTHTLTDSLDKLTGKEMLSRFNFEDMMMMRELNLDMNEKLFHKKERAYSLAGSIRPSAFRGDTGSNARYSLYNKRDGRWSVGLGIAFSNVYSDNAHDKDNRRDALYQLAMPIGYRRYGFNFITSPRIGYARGSYDRTGFNGSTYDGTIEKRVFGLMNEARYPITFDNGWLLEPAAEFNVLGYTQRGHEEDKDYALRIKSQSTYSVESGIGLYLTKEKDLTKDTKLKLTAGVAAYHEFADPYKLRVGMEGMDGSFTLRDDRRSDNRGVIRFGFDYEEGDYSLYGSIISYIDRECRTTAKSGIKWKF
ncbi:MAG: hypothetical protein IKS41_01445, partial [Alphaproteobacteria bacterium]|nr:hypothetical protein [Alphaproteobacteria bacterium]